MSRLREVHKQLKVTQLERCMGCGSLGVWAARVPALDVSSPGVKESVHTRLSVVDDLN